MSVHVIRPEPQEPFVQFQVIGGGETANSAMHLTWMLWPFDGRYEDVRMRVFPPNGECFDVRFDSSAIREALLQVAKLSDEKRVSA